MSPFTGDSNILNKVLHSDLLWKELRENIKSIRIFDRKEASANNLITIFKLESKQMNATPIVQILRY